MAPITSVSVDPDDGLEEDEPLFPWLPPDDRLWRHPSELASSFAAPSTAPTNPTSLPSAASSSAEGDEAAGVPTGTGRSPGTGATATALAPRELDRRLWSIALLAGVVGALLASGAGVVAGQYHRSTTIVRPIEQVVDPNSTYVTIATNPKSLDITDIALHSQMSIVELLINNNGTASSGSGVIYRNDGYILTNDHLVEGAQNVTAVTGDGHRITCHLVGTDTATDIGVVKMDIKPQQIATLGTSTQLKVGQLAIAVGSPLGVYGTHSVTSGIISGVDRQVASATGTPLLDMIATDAVIEQSSSGGALVDAAGMVVGITTAIGEEGMQATGFATPIEVARDVGDQLISTGKVSHPWLGVQGSDVDSAAAQALGITGGAVVQVVDSHSPAGQAGVTASDIITAFADQPVDSMSGLAMSVGKHRPGDKVELTFVHNGQTRTAEVTLQERPRSG